MVSRPWLEVALPLLDLHGAFLVVVDGAVGALGGAEAEKLFNDLRQGVGVGPDGPGAGLHPSERRRDRTMVACSPARATKACSVGSSASPRRYMGRSFA